MKLKGFKMTYDSYEDRIAFNIMLDDDTSYRFLLTRRLVRLLLPKLVRVLEEDEEVKQQLTPKAKRAVLEFQHEKALSNVKVRQEKSSSKKTAEMFQPKQAYLAVMIKVSLNLKTKLIEFEIQDKQKRGMVLAMDFTVLHSFYNILIEAAARSKWDLSLSLLTTPAYLKSDKKH